MAGNKFIGGIDLVGGELENAREQNLAADPTPLGKGHKYFNTVTNKTRTYNGTAWIESGSVDASDFISKTDTNPQSIVSVLNVPTPATPTNTTQVASTAFVQAAISAKIDTDANLTANSDSLVPSQKAVQTFVANKVAGLYDDRGNFDASGNTFPSSGGSGAVGAVLKGDAWRISVNGILGGVDVVVGDTIRALVDAPGQTAGNWAILQTEEISAGNGLTRTGNTIAINSATNIEAAAKASTAKVLTPSSLTFFTYKNEVLFGNTVLTSFPIAHERGSRLVIAQVFEVATGLQVYPKVVIDATNVTISGWTAPPTTDQYRVVISG